jgi:hypothetical protein
MAQIGEFAFVLLSRASNLHLVEVSDIMAFCNDVNYVFSCLTPKEDHAASPEVLVA